MTAAGLYALPRRWAPLPLLVGTCYMTIGQAIEVGPFHFHFIRLLIIKVGPFHFPIFRLLILAGLTRVIIRGERLAGRMNGMDWLMIVWSTWALISSGFHDNPSSALVSRLGMIYDACGAYFLFRIFCQSIEDVKTLCFITAVLLIPISVEMFFEKENAYNAFSMFGGVSEIPEIRGGRIRSQGPFSHSILAGTVGAVCLPLIVCLWQEHRKLSLTGIVACLLIIFTCGSSGPIMSAIAAIGALFMWRYREHMRFVRWIAILGYIALNIVMNAPAYYIIARINMIGESAGWHRARLIESAFYHLNEWWLVGTDFTRHWMPTGVPWSPDHADITNYYLYFGVVGGLPLIFLFMAILYKGFSFVGKAVGQASNQPEESRFFIWALGSSLFVHAVTFLSVSYFDQSIMFIYLTLAAISSIWAQQT